tara:strand:- start:378 stop:1034 length:657 start_codon:yes stop_codon:yes gene_type:complete
MSFLKIDDIEKISEFSKQDYQLIEIERKNMNNSDSFFREIMYEPFRVIGKISKKNSSEDIKRILRDIIPLSSQTNFFYKTWVSDMSEICQIFCDTLNSKSVSFCLATERGCSRYHIDNVPMRLLVTYMGQGTEWLPNEIANRAAFEEGLPNEKIVKDSSKIKSIKTFNVAIFRGGATGLLHRTPDSALKNPSILLRLDHESFWDNILKQQDSDLAFQV